MRWAGHVALMVEQWGCIGSWWGNRREGDHWGDLGVDGWIILERILVGKPERRRPLGIPRLRRVDNIRMDLGRVTGAKETTRET